MQIEHEIIEAGWPVGEILGSESELLDNHGVSRAVLREAIRLLIHHDVAMMRRGPGGGLVVKRPNPLASIRPVSLYLDYYCVEPHELSAPRITMMLIVVKLAAA